MDRRTLYVDVDDTLLLHDLSLYKRKEWVTIVHNRRSFTGVPHKANIAMLLKFYSLGYQVIVWSKTGAIYAQEVVSALKLSPYVDYCLTKPDYYLDDHDVNQWMGKRV